MKPIQPNQFQQPQAFNQGGLQTQPQFQQPFVQPQFQQPSNVSAQSGLQNQQFQQPPSMNLNQNVVQQQFQQPPMPPQLFQQASQMTSNQSFESIQGIPGTPSRNSFANPVVGFRANHEMGQSFDHLGSQYGLSAMVNSAAGSLNNLSMHAQGQVCYLFNIASSTRSDAV